MISGSFGRLFQELILGPRSFLSEMDSIKHHGAFRMKKQVALDYQKETCWECLLRLLRKEDPMTFREALKVVQRAQQDRHYRRH